MLNMVYRLSLLTVVLLAAIPALAQNITGTITGAVEDPTGAGVPQTPVVALNTERGISYKAVTSSEGVYVLPLLPLGDYQVTIEAPGFRKFVRGGLTLGADQRLRVDARLELGPVAEQVTVSAGAPLVTTDQATLGGSFSTSNFENLPIGRSVVGVMQLVPGTQANKQGIAVGNINGSRDTVVDVKVDGVPTTHTGNGLFSMGPPIVELVEEVVVQTASYSAESGRGVGQVNFTTRGGTNRLRGTAFYYLQNDILSANGFMNNFYGNNRAVLRFNLFGGTVSGPVILPKVYDGRNRTFFSFGYEGSRTRGFGQQLSTVPSPEMRAGNFSGQPVIYDPATTRANPAGTGSIRDAFPGNSIPASRVDSVASKMLAVSYPLPNLGGTVNNYLNTGSNPEGTTGTNTRLDHNFSEKSRMTGRYTYRWANNKNLQAFPGPAGAGIQGDRYHHVVSGDHVYLLRPNLINNFHFGFYRMLNQQTPPGADEDWAAQLGLKNLGAYAFPKVTVNGLAGFGGGNYVVRPQSNDFQFSDSLVWIRGRHSLKAGMEYRTLRYGNWQGSSGTFAFNTLPTMNPQNRRDGIGFASFLLGIPSTTTAAAIAPLPEGATIQRWKFWAGFLQDDYKATSNLTFNLGLRWEMHGPRTEDNDHQSMFNLKTLQLDYAGKDGYPRTLYDHNWNGFQPRFGFAYTPFGNTRTVLRGGYGIFFMAPNQAISGFDAGPWNPSFTYVSPDNGITFPLTLQTAVPPMTRNVPYVLGATTSVSWLPRDFKDANSQQWSFNIQREVRPGTVAEVGYVGTRGVHLPVIYELNQVPTALLGPGDAQSRRPYPTRGRIGADFNPAGNSTYHALQTRFERRLSKSFGWLAVYTFSKSIDDSSGIATARSFGVTSVQDNYNLRGERSLSAFDVTHNLAYSVAWELPFGKGRKILDHGGLLNGLVGGWRLSALSNTQSGMPLEMGTVTNLTGSLGGGSRPNRLRSGKLEGAQRGRLNWFDPSAFALPAAFSFGNTSRTEPGLRGPGEFNIDVLLAKEFRLRESVKLQFRSEFYNALNHFNPGDPNTTIGYAGVAAITGGNGGRNIQLSLKLLY